MSKRIHMARWLRYRTWHEVPSVLVTVLVGVITNLVTDSLTAALLLALLALVAIQLWLAIWQARRAIADARAARAEVLGELRPPVPDTVGELRWLTAPFSPTDLWARTAELDRLMAWCTKGTAPVRLLGGPAGVGKSRLALAVAEALPAPWVAGWLIGTADLVARVRACADPTLVIVDDADTLPDLDSLIRQASASPENLRILLLARDAEGLRAALRARLPANLRPLVDDEPMVLRPIGEEGDRLRWYAEAVRSYAKVLRVSPPEVGILPVGDDGDTMLVLHARALLAVLNRTGARSLSIRDVAAELFTMETGRWQAAPVTDDALTEVVLALTLLPSPDKETAVAVLRRLPRFRDSANDSLFTLVEWAWRDYPRRSDHRIDLRPHLVAEWLLLTHLADHPELLTDLPPVAITTLARACHTFPEAVDLLVLALQHNPARLPESLDAAFIALPASPEVDTTLAAFVEQAPAAFIGVADTPPGLPCLEVAMAARRIVTMRVAVEADRETWLATLANELRGLGVRLHNLGQYREALPITEEAVTLWLEIVHTDRAKHLPDLAKAVGNLGGHLIGLGRFADGLAAHEEALGIWRELARLDRAAHLAGLADMLLRVGDTLYGVGRPADALAATEEALGPYRELARLDRAAHLAGLANALGDLGVRRSEVGQPTEGRAAFEEAIGLWRELVCDDRAAHLSSLALVLDNFGTELSKFEQASEALAATKEALDLCRELVRHNRNAYPRQYVWTLENFGLRLAEVGRPVEALAAIEQAVGHWRRPVQANRDAYLPRLAAALVNLGIRLHEDDRPDEALGASEEGVALQRELVRNNRNAHLHALAQMLHSLSKRLSDAGRLVEAVAAIEEALEHWRELVRTNRDAHLPELANSLRQLGIFLGRGGHRSEELEVQHEVVTLMAECAGKYPDVYGPRHRRAEGRLRRLIAESGYGSIAPQNPPGQTPGEMVGSVLNLTAAQRITGTDEMITTD